MITDQQFGAHSKALVSLKLGEIEIDDPVGNVWNPKSSRRTFLLFKI